MCVRSKKGVPVRSPVCCVKSSTKNLRVPRRDGRRRIPGRLTCRAGASWLSPSGSLYLSHDSLLVSGGFQNHWYLRPTSRGCDFMHLGCGLGWGGRWNCERSQVILMCSQGWEPLLYAVLWTAWCFREGGKGLKKSHGLCLVLSIYFLFTFIVNKFAETTLIHANGAQFMCQIATLKIPFI